MTHIYRIHLLPLYPLLIISMSYIVRTSFPRSAFRAPIFHQYRGLATSALRNKTVTDTVKDKAEEVSHHFLGRLNPTKMLIVGK